MAARSPAGCGFQQAKPWPPVSSNGGNSAAQRASARGQRATNGQPGGRSRGLGTAPGIVASLPAPPLSRGIEASSPWV